MFKRSINYGIGIYFLFLHVKIKVAQKASQFISFHYTSDIYIYIRYIYIRYIYIRYIYIYIYIYICTLLHIASANEPKSPISQKQDQRYIYICNHENNVPSRLSPQWLCGNLCTWAQKGTANHSHSMPKNCLLFI